MRHTASGTRALAPTSPIIISQFRFNTLVEFYAAALADSQAELDKAIATGNLQAQRYYEGRIDAFMPIVADLAELEGGEA